MEEPDAIIEHCTEIIERHHKSESRSYIDVLTDHTGDPGHLKLKLMSVISAEEVVSKDNVSLPFYKTKVVACVEVLLS